MYMGNNKCKNMTLNRGKCDSNINITEISDKDKWTKECSVNWSNCKILNNGEIAPENNSSCNIDSNINYSDKPIIINRDASNGRLHSLIIYSGEQDQKTLNNNILVILQNNYLILILKIQFVIDRIYIRNLKHLLFPK